MVIKRVNRTQPIHVTEEKAPASGYIVKGIDGAHGCATVRRSHNHFDPDHAFEPDDPWFDHGHNRARRPYHKPLDATPSIPTIIASITVKSTVGDHCDIEVTDVNGNIIDHLPCVLERLQSLKVASQTAVTSSDANLASTQSNIHGRHSPRRSLRHSQRNTPRASRVFDAASARRPASPSVSHRRRGGSRGERLQQDQRMPSAKHKEYMQGGQFRIGDVDALHKFFYYRFFILEQNPCKKIIKFLIDAIVHKKQTMFPYQGKPKQGRAAAHLPDNRTRKTPGFWPPGIPYTGPDRANRRERLTILAHLMMLPLKDDNEWRAIVQHQAYASKWNSYHECLLSILDERKLASHSKPVLGDKERADTSKDVDGNWIRHNARLGALRELIDIAGQIERCALDEIDDTHVITYQPLDPGVEHTKGKQGEELEAGDRPRLGDLSRFSSLKPTDTAQRLDGDGDTESSDLEDWEPCDDFVDYHGDATAAVFGRTQDDRSNTESWTHVKSDTDDFSTQPTSGTTSFGSSFAASYDGDAAPSAIGHAPSTRSHVPAAPKLACAEAVRPSGTKRSSAADQDDRVAKSRLVAELRGPAAPSSRLRDGTRGRANTNSSRRSLVRSSSASPANGLPNQLVYAGLTGVADDLQYGRPTPSLRYTSTQYYPATDYATYDAEVRAGQHVPGQAHSGFQPPVARAAGHEAIPWHAPVQRTSSSARPPSSDAFLTLPQNIDPQLMDTNMTDGTDSFQFGESYSDYLSASGFPSFNNIGSAHDDYQGFDFTQPEFYANGAPRGSYYRNNFA